MQAICCDLGRKLTMEGSGGAADANFSSAANIPSLDRFDIVSGIVHTENEDAKLNGIAPKLCLMSRMTVEQA